jgi:hypothetical protein
MTGSCFLSVKCLKNSQLEMNELQANLFYKKPSAVIEYLMKSRNIRASQM